MAAPLSLHNDGAAGVLTIGWDDDHEQRLDNVYLRSQCRCAECKSTVLRTGRALPVDPQTRITGIRPVGSYAVQLVFSDGHERGIFPWAYLRELGEPARAALSFD
jgi:DUF971 family protein